MSVRLLRREVLQNVSVIRPPWGKTMDSLLWVGLRACLGRLTEGITSLPGLSLHRTGLGSEPEELMHGVITQDLCHVGLCVVAWARVDIRARKHLPP